MYRSIDTMLEVQRFWAEDRNVEAVSSLTAPSFHGISDLQTEALLLASQKGLTEESKDKKFILMPYLDTNEPCFRCGSTFKTENNPSDACVFHECSDGTRGDFAEVGSRNGNKPKRWTCCGSLDESDPGCCARPHACKEMMFTFRAEASPSVRVGNIDIALYKTMEISVFPGASYDLKLLITRNLLDVVHNYFSISGVEANDVAMEDEKLPDGTEGSVKPIGPQSDADFLHTQSTLDVLSMKGRTAVDPIANMPVTKASSRGSRFLHLFRGKKHSEEDATVSAHSPAGNQPPGVPGMVTNSSMLGATTTTAAAVNLDAAVWDPQSTVHPHQQLSQFTVRARGMSRSSVRLRTGTVTFAENNNVDLSSSSGPTGAPTGSIMVSSNSGAARQEALFIRYLRVGEISVDVTTAGFPLNITNYKATVDPFFKRGTVMDWHRLILKIERHAKLSVARHTASNSISTIGNILFAKTPSRHLESKPSGIIATSSKAPELTSSNADQEQLKLQEDQDEKASQLLGGKETKPKRPLSGYFLGRRTLVASHSSSGGSLGSLREQSAAAKSKSSEEKNIHQFLGSS